MRTFLCLALIIVTSCQTNKTLEIRFDGYYQSVDETITTTESKETAWMYIRFYPNGKVISVTSVGTVSEVTSWFNLGAENISEGNYHASKNKIDFSTTSKSGTVVYNGKILDNNHLDLNSKSLINGHMSNEKYSFIKIPDLK